ncbi:hypothetical protein PybrP1_006352 [[Pythium] brassicae (nom. inval.)]|nr:hypothetical protein PybrP1_006352 [[Pythium] brassicae (nom. inval.)]
MRVARSLALLAAAALSGCFLTHSSRASPFEAVSLHLQREYERFESEQLRLALLTGAGAVRADLVARDREAFLQRLRTAEPPDTVPADVRCEKVQRCDKKGVCAVVCARGSVETDAWAARALHLQRKLAYERTLCTAQLPGSHNSAINIADGYGVEDHVFEGYLKYVSWFKSGLRVHTNDQLFSLTDQLQMGVRFVELDVHWFNRDLHIAHCGGFRSSLLDGFIGALNEVAKLIGTDIQWDSETIGCKPSLSSIPASEQRSLDAALAEIAAWLHAPANQDEFLLVFFDDEANLIKWKKIPRLLELVKQHFRLDEILLPADFVQHGYEWPVFRELLALGKRVMFLSGADYSPEGDELLFVKDSICDWQEPPLPFLPFPTCRFHRPNFGPLDANRTIFRPETSEIVYGFLNADGKLGKNEYVLDETTLPPLVACGVNIPSPDNITPTRMASTIWAFARDSAALVPGQCVGIVRSDGAPTWRSVDCEAPNMVAACVDAAHPSTWRLGEAPVAEAKSAASCAALAGSGKLGYGAPASGYENKVVFDLLAQAPAAVGGVWVNAKAFVDEVYFPGGDASTPDSAALAADSDDVAERRDDTTRQEMRQEHALLSVE